MLFVKLLSWRRPQVDVTKKLKELMEELRISKSKEKSHDLHWLSRSEPTLFCEYLLQRFKEYGQEEIDFEKFVWEVLAAANDLAMNEDSLTGRAIIHPLVRDKVAIWMALECLPNLVNIVFPSLLKSDRGYKKFWVSITKKRFLSRGVPPPWDEPWFMTKMCKIGKNGIPFEEGAGLVWSIAEHECLVKRIESFFECLKFEVMKHHKGTRRN